MCPVGGISLRSSGFVLSNFMLKRFLIMTLGLLIITRSVKRIRSFWTISFDGFESRQMYSLTSHSPTSLFATLFTFDFTFPFSFALRESVHPQQTSAETMNTEAQRAFDVCQNRFI